ncbi:ERF family protein [Streptococcus pseudopneumoniae]|uniref:ERF family protein n=1 Tax=Streptococcus pseudopneumoniae TaxID=257758 RepID=UPI001C655E11|nr:ERF family protein [Streptococcus pseudopneumoniae]MBW8099080.1 ERF family protein [Streptococcus pseudopneumoniae]
MTKLAFSELQKRMQLEKKKKQGVNYAFRNAEDIYTKFKEINTDWELTVSDDLFGVGERIFVKSTAIVSNGDKQFQSVGFAELDEVPVFKTGNQQMQVPQWTGAVSSYARKYALQGLFGIGEKDVDEYPSDMNEAENQQAKKANDPVISVEKANYYLKEIAAISVEKGKEDGSIVKWFLNHLGVVDYKMIKQSQIEDADILLAKLKGN